MVKTLKSPLNTAVIGFPRIGAQRELKFILEKYFAGTVTQRDVQEKAKWLRAKHWEAQINAQIGAISSNDFSFYDNVLDTAVLLNCIPQRYQALKLSPFDTYLAMARGYQGKAGDVKALAMKKWFNTNYHYIVPEIEDNTKICLAGTKPLDEAAECPVKSKTVITGPFTFLKLARFTGKKRAADFLPAIVAAYSELFRKLTSARVTMIQLDEPSLVCDLTPEDVAFFHSLYSKLLDTKGSLKVLLQTYFGDIRDCYREVISLPFDCIGLDFVEGQETFSLLERYGFPATCTLFAGLLNGKNIWATNYTRILERYHQIQAITKSNVILNTSCSLLHVPYSLAPETALSTEQRAHLAFAQEKLLELRDLGTILDTGDTEILARNAARCATPRGGANPAVQAQIAALTKANFTRQPAFAEREAIQRTTFKFPLLPTTTIGSFPQTAEVRANRAAFKKGTLSEAEYIAFNHQKTAECIALQEKLGLDVLVHGEFERTDMVEFFAESLNGYLRTTNGWVQSYGTRCVKPPLVWGDVSRRCPMTVKTSVFAQSCTTKPVKGMLTGPVTILNWSFPRDDISLKTSAQQIALAIREEVLDLEAHGIQIIQIDEAALREKLPLRRCDWHKGYLDWAIPAFRLGHSGVKATTQIHTHMCYSEFADIIHEIDAMDADVISFEASRSDLTLLDVLVHEGFKTQVGPGVYDIHSPRVPSKIEIERVLRKLLTKLPKEKLWVNPDCGLKTRGEAETTPSLANLVAAAKAIRAEL